MPQLSKQEAWVRFFVFAAIVAVALAMNQRSQSTHREFPSLRPNRIFPVMSGPFSRTETEIPQKTGRRELWASYRSTTRHDVYVSLGLGSQSFHNWIECFLVQGPKPLWSGTIAIPGARGQARFEATVLRREGQLRAVAHSECWHGQWRGSAWQDRWFALWRRPGQAVPLLNADLTAGDEPGNEATMRQELAQFLASLDWEELDRVCRLAR